jgi:8-oxo-dGTP pyrophosphatase MutT (NUDIX family)
LLVPGAQVVVVDDADRVLFQRRQDTGLWDFPGGAAEPGQSFRDTAAQELFEEAGLKVEPEELVPFASLSEPELHSISYPNGDQIHAFSLCFEARQWSGELNLGADEVLEAAFFDVPPEQTQPQTLVVWDMYRTYRSTGVFQAR